jgi:hypothetical protein
VAHQLKELKMAVVRRIRRAAGQIYVTETEVSTSPQTDDNREATELEMAFGEALAMAFTHGGPKFAGECRAMLED